MKVIKINDEYSGRREYTSLELCAGAGGQALGVEQAGFHHLALIEYDGHAVNTLRLNRPNWNVVQADITKWSGVDYRHKVDLLAGGLPCPPFSKAGKQLGSDDERNLFPAALRVVDEIQPRAIMIENVRGILDNMFQDFRLDFQNQVGALGYKGDWKIYNACDFGVPQLRPRVTFVALRKDEWKHFTWPTRIMVQSPTVGETLKKLMMENGWKGCLDWARRANEIAPTLVGGSKKHGGPDLGPTRARLAWAKLGVDGLGLANAAPGPDFVGMPRLTVAMTALIQGFPASWQFSGKKTAAYRQVGNAFPPPVACAIAGEIHRALALATKQMQAA